MIMMHNNSTCAAVPTECRSAPAMIRHLHLNVTLSTDDDSSTGCMASWRSDGLTSPPVYPLHTASSCVNPAFINFVLVLSTHPDLILRYNWIYISASTDRLTGRESISWSPLPSNKPRGTTLLVSDKLTWHQSRQPRIVSSWQTLWYKVTWLGGWMDQKFRRIIKTSVSSRICLL